MVEFSPFYKCIDPEVYNLNPDEQWTSDQLCELAVEEVWELDTIGEERILALKHLFHRLLTPREHWKTIDEAKFLKLVKQKYKERLNEE